ncbi:hypothetical protein OH807_30070 [Kitasatospora sp. NBC_01560]|uniref:hypothetical protein n=1 Tax=Kitasatospora sp. NBC_01560 TaxID=2975965 RepID=UPI003863BA16
MTVQVGWASCPKCQGLHYAGFDFKGVCPAGGPHEQVGSFSYTLRYDVAGSDQCQPGWAACPKCQGLFYGPFHGVCPAGGTHTATGSYAYGVTYGVSVAYDVQLGWTSCAKCQGLFYGPYGGACPAGDLHSTRGSFDYALGIEHPFIEGFVIRGTNIVVSGRGFTHGGSVRVRYWYSLAGREYWNDKVVSADSAGALNQVVVFSSLPAGAVHRKVQGVDLAAKIDSNKFDPF